MRIQYYIIITLVLMLSSCSENGRIPIYGCTDPNSINFDSDADVDDGSCCSEELLSECDVCDENYTYHFWTDIVGSINSHQCSVCHSSSNPDANLSLWAYEGYYNSNGVYLKGILDVVENCSNTENSLLLHKIDGGSMSSYASPELIDMIRIWISEGAPE